MDSWVFDFVGYVHATYHNTDENPVNVDPLMNYVIAGMERYEEFGLPFN